MLIILGIMGATQNEQGQFNGQKRAGKDTIADLIEKWVVENYPTATTCKLAFAYDLKNNVCGLYEWSVEEMETKKNEIIPSSEVTYRRVLEYMGSEVCKKIDPQVWTNSQSVRTLCRV